MMNDSSATSNTPQSDVANTAPEEITTDATDGADKEWPDEAKIVPDTYLGDSK